SVRAHLRRPERHAEEGRSLIRRAVPRPAVPRPPDRTVPAMTSPTSPSAAAAAGMSTDPVTERVRATWTTRDLGRIAAAYTTGAAEFVARLRLAQGERVLDVACGTGNFALPAARAGALTTGIDIAPNLIAQAVASAAAEGLAAHFEVGDAESLPYAD